MISIEFDKESPGESDSRTLDRETLDMWTGRIVVGTGVCEKRKRSSG